MPRMALVCAIVILTKDSELHDGWLQGADVGEMREGKTREGRDKQQEDGRI